MQPEPEQTGSITVAIVDDDPMVRTALSMILRGDPALRLVAEAQHGQQAVEELPGVAPDVVLMDIRMPVRDGLSATQALMELPQPPRVLVLTTFDTDDMVLEALRIGAAGFLLKDTPPRQLVEAIKAVAAGQPSLSPSVTATLIANVAAGAPAADVSRAERARALLATLTEREVEVARGVARGLSNAEIAEELVVSVPTVKTHVGAIFAKLQAENRVHVAIVVHDAGQN